MKKAFLILLLATVFSCAVQDQKPKIMVTHVLAVTEAGDTLRLPINMIRPNVYYKIVKYPNNYYNNWNQYPGYYQPYYNNNRPIYTPSNNSNSNNNNNSSKPAPNKPATSEQNLVIRNKKGGN